LKTITRILIFALAGTLIGGMAWPEKKERKLPVGAYIKSAKIDILSGEFERYQTAIAMLDSLFMYYGPHAEALYLMGQIMVDFVEKTASLKEKAPYLEKMVAYIDSLDMCCSNKEIKKSYRKDCKEFTVFSDSLKVKYWRDFFNAGVNHLSSAEKLHKDFEAQADSSIRSYLEKDLKTNVDNAIENIKLAIIAIPDSSRTYLIIDKAYGMRGDYKSGIEWLQKGLEQSGDSSTIVPSIAYDYIQLGDYCGAIPYYKARVMSNPDDVTTLINLAICYNNCNMYDSALSVYHRILTMQPENANVITNVGLYYNTKARIASDSASKYQNEENQELAATWRDRRKEAFDSSRVYFRRTFELKPDDAYVADQYGIVCALLGDYQEAVIGFTKVVKLKPENSDHWISLGDCHLNLRQFDDAILAYEKVVELEPDNVSVWEHLKDLYFETGRKSKLAEVEKKLNELKQ